MSVFTFVCWYYPIGLYRNAYATDQVDERGITLFLIVWMFFIFTSTFGTMMIAGVESNEIAGAYANVLSIMMIIFCGYASSLLSPTVVSKLVLTAFR
jgi:ATP-binding cassette, subfamily G (WHITE), member 2, PDR